jgi:VanZ family protein
VDRRWIAWCAYFVPMTILLVAPGSDEGGGLLGGLEPHQQTMVAKSVHVVIYAGLTVLTGWLRVPPPWRLVLLFVLMLHGAATEFVQQFVPNRTGMLRDVLFDHLGVAVGLCISWKWWTRAAP